MLGRLSVGGNIRLILRWHRIIKDFYVAEPDLAKRPKIFGMTASPVDAKVDVVQAAKLVKRYR